MDKCSHTVMPNPITRANKNLAEDRRRVSMSRALINARHNLSLAEKRIVGLAIAKLDSRICTGITLVSRINAREYSDVYGIRPNTAYEQLRSAAKSLFGRTIIFGSKTKISDIRWVGRCTYHIGQGEVELVWFHEIVPELRGLRENYISYVLMRAAPLHSVYSWRLLELLVQYPLREGKITAIFNIEEFKLSIGAEKAHAKYSQLRKKIIEPAVDELTRNGWSITSDTVKLGRKIVKLKFVAVPPPKNVSPPALEAPDSPRF